MEEEMEGEGEEEGEGGGRGRRERERQQQGSASVFLMSTDPVATCIDHTWNHFATCTMYMCI